MTRNQAVDLGGFVQTDRSRRALGRLLDQMGWGARETPARVVFSRPGLKLDAYGGEGPVLLLIPAPIKRAYIWDLTPACSVVRQLLHGGTRVYLIEWQDPPDENRGLADYANRMILDCLDAIAAETAQRRVTLAGHSLGGTLAAIFSTLHPERVRALILLAAPLHFGPGAGVFGAHAADYSDVQRLTGSTVPGSFLNAVSFAAAPMTFGWSPWLDWLASMPDAQARDRLLRIERWALDELPLPRRLITDVVQMLFRDDRFVRGTLTLDGRRAAPERFTAPVLSAVDSRCALVPPESVLPFHRAIRSADSRILYYDGDTGVLLQHIGMLVGRSAHERLWPEILRWIRACERRRVAASRRNPMH